MIARQYEWIDEREENGTTLKRARSARQMRDPSPFVVDRPQLDDPLPHAFYVVDGSHT